ncbi:MAG: Rrf2 family transcriptional regulator [Candidatus Limnocylindrales bacterium]|jgi:Rrf2 family protein
MRLDLTKRSDYAIRAMLALTQAGGGLLSSRKIAEEMKIPPRFLPQIMGDLTRAGLVDAHPGRAGGYKLAKPASSVTLLTVIEAVEGDPHRQICVMRGTACGQDGECGVHDVFYAAESAILEKLSGATLQGVIDAFVAKQAAAASR